jgi:hypothetical protein
MRPVPVDAYAFWLREPGYGEIRRPRCPNRGGRRAGADPTLRGQPRHRDTGVRGGVPAGQHVAVRAPFQEGEFPGPVKYGYLNVGTVEAGPPELRGRTVFCLYPHQTAYVVPPPAVTLVPDGVPPARAVLAGTVETAVNALWDAAPLLGDRVAVVGAGMVGCCVARLLSRFPAVQGSRSGAHSIPVASVSAQARSAPSPRVAAAAERWPTGWRSHSNCCATLPSTYFLPAGPAS